MEEVTKGTSVSILIHHHNTIEEDFIGHRRVTVLVRTVPAGPGLGTAQTWTGMPKFWMEALVNDSQLVSS